ncbi:MAG: hypothetical protein AAB417_00005, partial [Patescibacteria group bacterium]
MLLKKCASSWSLAQVAYPSHIIYSKSMHYFFKPRFLIVGAVSLMLSLGSVASASHLTQDEVSLLQAQIFSALNTINNLEIQLAATSDATSLPFPPIACPSPQIVSDLYGGERDLLISRNPIVRARGEVTALQDFLWQYKGRYSATYWSPLNNLTNKSDLVTGYYGSRTSNIVKAFQQQFGVSGPNLGDTEFGKVFQKTRTEIERQCVSSLTISTPNGGETWHVGTTTTVKWASNNIATTTLISFGARNLASNTDYSLGSGGFLNDGKEVINVPTALPGGSYLFFIKANVGGVIVNDWSDGSFMISVPPPPPMIVAPGTLFVSHINATSTPYSVRLTWRDSSTNEGWFVLERSTTASTTGFSWIAIPTTLCSACSGGYRTYTDTSVSFGTTYYYRVKAENASVQSAYSKVVSTFLGVPPPPPGTALNVVSGTQPQPTLATQGALGLPFTRVRFTADSDGDVAINSLTVERVGLLDDAAFTSIVLLDENGNHLTKPIRLDMNHKAVASFLTPLVVRAQKTRELTIAANMACSLTNYAGHVGALSLVAVNTS